MTRKDKKSTHKLFYLCAYLLLTSHNLDAQVHTVYLPENKWLTLAEEQFAQEQYRSAMQSADAYLQQSTSVTDPRQHYENDKAGYFSSVAALKLNIVNCEEKAVQFIKQTANPVYKQRTAYALAQFCFEKQMLDNAIEYYELAGISNLNNKEVISAKFELAYCYFNRGRFAEAEPLLASVHQLDGKYFTAGNYYYGLLAYNQNKYAEALDAFKAIEHNREYTAIVPYYIAEIYYFTGNKDKALQDALRLIRRPEKSFYHNELHLLAAQIYFEAKDYAEALPYFEYFYDHTDRIRKEDLYEMAYTYYRLSDWENAVDNFKQLSDTRDSLGQSSMYLLGDCYLKINDKKSARNAFSICADMPFNQKQKEAALFLTAKLSYELGYNVDAIYNINILLADFPGSRHQNEAKTLLSELLIKTHNYAEAYKALQDVTDNSEAYHRVYQKVAYSYALQQMQLGNNSFADSLLSRSLKHRADATYTAAAQFWKSELAYGMGKFDDALTYGRTFIDNDRGAQWVEYLSPQATDRNAFTTMGYASMKLAHFTDAQEYFSRAKNSTDAANDSIFVVSSTLREADAVFMQKDYKKAIELYDAVIASGYSDVDYAHFQKATILGLEGEYKKKEHILNDLINNEPPSRYANAARYELGLSYIEQNKYTAAVNIMMPLTEAYEVRNMAPKAWMKIGFAYQQARKPAQAIEAYKKIAIEYPTSEERPAALDALKSLYIQAGQPEAYAQLRS
ncbi:MAG: tetratricopeptide repeat protein, partial [Chitinophagaceae bacterium]|nr:tetratricopeptide repeat protein [Chitinophagaceae bacterium]